MKLKLFLFILLASVFCFAGNAFAMTEQERQALIIQINQQIIQLQEQIAQMLAEQPNFAWCHTFNSDLGYLNSGYGVFNLHIALQKQGISYSPDNVNTYSTGTSQAVMQLQLKYGIRQTGYVGPLTRAKLNSLYGCGAPIIACTTPNWQCSGWGLCFSGQQTRTCTDSNNCGVNTKKPAELQSCTQKPGVRIQANNSDGPVNIFLTSGNGADINNSGISLSESVSLQWSSIDVSSCRASDSITPTIFSGYQPSYGSQVVFLSGNIKGVPSSSSKVSDTFKITCISTATGNTVSDSVTVNLFYNVSGTCSPNWSCTEWTNCSSSKQTRICTDYNGCASLVGKPIESQPCVMPPTANIKANGSEGPITVNNGSSVTLSWTSINGALCVASGNWSGQRGGSGTQSVTVTATPETFIITCRNAGGVAEDSVTVYTTGG